MSPKKAFSYYHGIHLHFTTESYSILKYGSDTKLADSKFKTMSSGNRFRFQWLSDHFQTTENVVFACIASELNGLDCKFSNKQDILDVYHDFKSRRDSMTYVLTNEYIKYDTSKEYKFHQLLFSYFAGLYSPEFVLLIDHETNYLNHVLNHDSLTFARHKILRLLKYKDFFSPTKYTYLLNKNHEEPVSA